MLTEGECRCGCGRPAPLATRTDTRYGWVRGQPKPFVNGHQARATATYPMLGDEAWLRARYVDEGMSTQAMAEMLGCSQGTVLRALKVQGIPCAPRGYRPRGPVHGTYYAYEKYGCRCAACREANSVKCRRRWEAKRLREIVALLATWTPPPTPLMLVSGFAPLRVCVRCGKEFVGASWRRWCSGSCNKADWHDANRRPSRVWTMGWCARCGNPFVGSRADITYCSIECVNKEGRKRRKHVRRVLERTAPCDRDITLYRLAVRDGWTCHVCGGPVARDNWSMDHLRALSQGGHHTWVNVALAHHACNTARWFDEQAA